MVQREQRFGPSSRRAIGTLRRLLASEDGATAIEYALIAALFAVSCIAGYTAFGSSMTTMYGTLGTAIDSK